MALSVPAPGKRMTPRVSWMSAVAALWTAISRRRVLGTLEQLDDRMLRDIGITRIDVMSAMSGSLFLDPTVQLVVKAAESRSAARSASLEAAT